MQETRQQRRERLEREEKQKTARRDLMNKCKGSIRSDVTALGFRSVKLTYEYFKATPGLVTKYTELSREEVLECYEYVFENHKSK